MEPAHRSAFARVAEGLQLVVPGGSEKLGDRDTQWLRTERVGEDRGLEPTFRYDDVAGEACLGAEQPESRRVADAAALREGRGLFGDLETDPVPAREHGGDLLWGADGALPRVLRPIARALSGLWDPVEPYGHADRAGRRPLDVRAKRRRCGVDVEHSAGQAHRSSQVQVCLPQQPRVERNYAHSVPSATPAPVRHGDASVRGHPYARWHARHRTIRILAVAHLDRPHHL